MKILTEAYNSVRGYMLLILKIMRSLFYIRKESILLEKSIWPKPSNIYNCTKAGPLKKIEWVVCRSKDRACAFHFVLDSEN